MNILVVDDEKLILKGIKQILENEISDINQIGTASSAEEALVLFSELKPSIVLSDIKMPGMSGLELIHKLKKTDIPFKSVIISSYDDFEYAKEGIILGIENYLIKPINKTELIHTVVTTQEKINNELQRKQLWTDNEREIFKDNFLRRILTHSLSSEDYQNWEELLIPYKKWSKIATTYITFNENFSIDSKKELADSLRHSFPSIDLIKLTSDELIIIYNSSKISNTDLKAVLAHYKDSKDMFGTFGHSVNEIDTISESFQKAKTLQSYSLVFGFGKFIDEHDINKDYEFTDEIIKQKELSKLIIAGNQEDIRKKFQFIEKKINDSPLNPIAIQNLTIGIGMMLQRLSTDLGLIETNHIMDLRNLVENITKQKTTHKIFEYLYDITIEMMNKINNQDITYSPVTQHILKVVNDDLSIHHSLKTLADQFHMNSAYLGQLFQKEVGVSFNQYCHHQRMKKANEMILHTTTKISDIAKAFGYDDVSYFYRLYKKDFGVTPNKIRSNKFNA